MSFTSVAVIMHLTLPAFAGICALICFWPLLCCLPLVYVGSRDASKALSDRTCCKCRMRCDYRGLLKSPPTRVPPINPGALRQRRHPHSPPCLSSTLPRPPRAETQQPNSTYGYTTTMLYVPTLTPRTCCRIEPTRRLPPPRRPKPPPSVPYVKATQRWSDDEPPRAADAAGKKAL